MAEPEAVLLSGAVRAAERDAVVPLSGVLSAVEYEGLAALAEPEAAVLPCAALLVVEYEGLAALAAGAEVAGVAALQVSVDIAVAFVVSVLVSAAAAGAGSSEHPSFPAFPSADCFANSSSSVGLAAGGIH